MPFGFPRLSSLTRTQRSERTEPAAAGQNAQTAEHDPFALEALSLLDALYGMALRLTRDRDRAQDLVQDTYLKAFRARQRFAAGTNLKAWLFTILQNTWRNGRRDHARARIDFDSQVVEEAGAAPDGPASSMAEDPEALLLRADLDAELKAALEMLPEAFREAVWLRDVEDLSYQQIADVLGIPIGTVMSRIARGRKQLHHLLRGLLSPRQLSPTSAARR
jgi:RNA polymerase sigma-70 factor (ECF subfamily)